MTYKLTEQQREDIHDCYNSIAAVTCYAQILVQELNETTEQHSFAKNILTSSNHAKTLLDDIVAALPQDDKGAKDSDETKKVV